MGQWYEDLFKNYSHRYDQESFTQGTIGEVDFIENEIDHNKSVKIIDVGCGTGRHSIELAKRGYKVTGIDLSTDQLQRAQEKAGEAGVKITFEQKDARNFCYPNQFDLAIMLCEGAFPLMETDEMNFQIIKNIHDSLAPKGKLIFTTLNGLFPLFHSVKDFINNNFEKAESSGNTFDLMTFRDYSVFEIVNDLGETKLLECNERYYVPSEITWLLKSIGFKNIAIHGATLGAFSREDKLTTEDYEMLVIAEKE
jgi:2-polyprenyl-3-methyl-5-hydroxy-6-metoxy-1,4-benzoquinol methylase